MSSKIPALPRTGSNVSNTSEGSNHSSGSTLTRSQCHLDLSALYHDHDPEQQPAELPKKAEKKAGFINKTVKKITQVVRRQSEVKRGEKALLAVIESDTGTSDWATNFADDGTFF